MVQAPIWTFLHLHSLRLCQIVLLSHPIRQLVEKLWVQIWSCGLVLEG